MALLDEPERRKWRAEVLREGRGTSCNGQFKSSTYGVFRQSGEGFTLDWYNENVLPALIMIQRNTPATTQVSQDEGDSLAIWAVFLP